MEKIPVYCKSYHRDVLRVRRLLESLGKYNQDNLPVFVSMPAADRQLFVNTIGRESCHLLDDEEIISANPAYRDGRIFKVSPGLTQQVIKSEFWRLQTCSAYLCIDSDSRFIRPFNQGELLAPDGVPYTTLHQCKDFLQLAGNMGKHKVVENFIKDSAAGRALFGRVGPEYDFGPTPVVWASKVWQDLDSLYLQPKGWSLLDAIEHYPAELRWYGEALLAYGSIPLHPREPLFRVYHTDWQYYALRRQGESEEKLRDLYLGVVSQSNWEYEIDFGEPQKSLISRLARAMRRKFRQFA